MNVWQFIQDQILGMKWPNQLIGSLLSMLGLNPETRIGGSIQFFIYDVLKITILLCLLIFVISYIQSYFPPERSKRILGRFHGIGANIMAALLGTVTPFCSCSSIPLFIGFTSAGLPLGVTFSFLISSPMVDLGSLVLLISIFGTKVAVIYVIVGLSKLLSELPPVDIVVTMGCNVQCPYLPCRYRMDWGLDDPTGQPDEVFLDTIQETENRILELKDWIKTQYSKGD